VICQADLPVFNLQVARDLGASQSLQTFSDFQGTQNIIPLQTSHLLDKTGRQSWLMFGAAVFLVSVPVFIQAPLVRSQPLSSLLLTIGWLIFGEWLFARAQTRIWGDLLLGFTWTWYAGSLYWGWLRWEPFLHLPIEAIGLPFVLWELSRNRGKIGNFFYLGSLLGTAVTDLYFYLVDLIPHWRKLMEVGDKSAGPIFQSAIAQIQTPWGIAWAIILAGLLLTISLCSLRSKRLHWWAFSGAVLSTILVDGLFWLAGFLASR
jgi:hypothetical protein